MQEYLNELLELTKVERVRELDSTESNRYIFLFEELRRNNIEIPFGAED